MVKLAIFDDGEGMLGPLDDLRSAMFVRTGALRNVDRLVRQSRGELVGVFVSEEMAGLAGEQADGPVNDWGRLSALGDVLVVNGRLVVLPDEAASLKSGHVLTDGDGGAVLSARLSGADAMEFLRGGSLPEGVSRAAASEARVLRRPWDVIRHRDAALAVDLKYLGHEIAESVVVEGTTMFGNIGVHVHETARVYPGVVLNAEQGPIVVDQDAVIRPGAMLTGPVYVGAGSTVLEQAHIKSNTAIGPVCKVAGEIGGTIFQGYANKAHDGHLGDSWIGEWANLGAGTTNSNLLNTYGQVTAQIEPGGTLERTGLTILGAIIGDHVKTAICTRLMTGTMVGTGAMLAQSISPPRAVGRFEWLTDERKQTYRLNKFVDVMKTVMGRRGIEASEAYVRRVGELHASASR